ncbi:hypothetical protein CVCC1112_259 [Paenarthrobacter nicotinovorans]|jgi:hypothetical protein|nr:hypothetical protein ANMWB30_33590 [Arthrobacter sp. MWB30]GAT85599.1 hypothetical protein CVCC1112_259 [Paenarthrobacter nicotinovorans]
MPGIESEPEFEAQPASAIRPAKAVPVTIKRALFISDWSFAYSGGAVVGRQG